MRKSTKPIKNIFKSIEYIGWLGVALLLLNYFLLSSGLLKGDGITYHAIALTGSLFLGWEAWVKRDRQPAVLNFIFVAIAVYAIVRLVITI